MLVLVGFGTKVGLAPMHTWLPDAHSEGPAPVSAMLSGALLNCAMLGIVRYLHILQGTSIETMARTALVVLGAFSLLVAALFISRQTIVKRLAAYSSVEHMGVIALGFGFGGPLGVIGALYHMLNHSLTKSLVFFGAGNMMHAYESKDIAKLARASLPRYMVPNLYHKVAVMPHNPNGSMASVEGITSPDGRVFGKMGHDERCGKNLLRNVGGSSIDLFRAGVEYFK